MIAPSAEAILTDAFANSVPVVAVLGQDAGKTPNDGVLERALERAGKSGSTWKELLGGTELPVEFYMWLSEQFQRQSASNDLLSICDAQFSAIYSSSIDPRLANLFETSGREPETIFLGDPPPPIKRSRRRPPIYSLFGKAGSTIPNLMPPRNTAQLSQRRMLHASPMLRTILETATTLGLVVVDGFVPSSDWLRAEDLLAVLSGAPVGGILWFGSEPQFSEDDQPIFDQMVGRGTVIRDYRSLGEVLARIAVDARGTFDERWDDPELVSFASGKKLITSPALRLATEASATIVDDACLAFQEPLAPEELRAEFRTFHAVSTGARPLIAGVRRGFAIERDFETQLRRRVDKAVARHHEEDGAIILHGQSASGKSIALARLALGIRQTGTAAVLLAFRAMPQPSDVGDFLAAVDALDEVTVLIADATTSPHRYDDLLTALRSRGHRVVVIGTSYRQESIPASAANRFVTAARTLSVEEKARLRGLADRFIPRIGQASEDGDQYALAGFFYRLPASRARISEGLGREARFVGAEMAERGGRRKPLSSLGGLGTALVEAGFPVATEALLEDEAEPFGDWGDETAANRIIDYVMVAARLYKWVPINLLLRAVRKEAANNPLLDLDMVRELFSGHDLFHWRLEDAEGQELLIGARLQLEAELICNRRLGGAVGEANRLIELISAGVRAGDEGNTETRFIADLVIAIGPDGPFEYRYQASYADVAQALTNLRQRYSVENARLMLQEATLRRHFVRLPGTAHKIKTQLLDEARSAVDSALDALERPRARKIYASRRTIDNLWVERAATYGFLATDASEVGAEPGEIWRSYQAARSAVRKASGRVDSYFPLDIALWLPARILRTADGLRDEWKVELEADIRSTLDLVDPVSLDAKQFEKFQSQRLKCGEALEDLVISDAAFEELRLSGSTAGYYVRARALAPNRPDEAEDASPEDVARAGKAASYLWSIYHQISSDPRCLLLLLSCEWLISTERWLLRGSRQPLPAGADQLQRINRVLSELANVLSDDLQAKHRYLVTVFKWLLDNEKAATDDFRRLASDTEYVEGGRVIIRHEITNENGQPRSFDGIVMRRAGETRWSVFVEELQRHVDLVETDFRNYKIERGKTVRRFSIGFNFLGPLAKPIVRP